LAIERKIGFLGQHYLCHCCNCIRMES
jgi:hypothetical protein